MIASHTRVGRFALAVLAFSSWLGLGHATSRAFDVPPTIVQQPTDQIAFIDIPVTFSVVATGTAPLSYQWRRNGVPLVEQPQRIEGTTSPTVYLYVWSLEDEGNYDCVVTNAAGSVTSDTATLTVPVGGITGAPMHVARVAFPPARVPGLDAIYDVAGGPIRASDGDIVFGASIHTPPAGQQRGGLTLSHDGGISVLVLQGDQAPGTPSGVEFGTIYGYVAAAGSKVIFSSDLVGAGIDASNMRGLWYSDPGGTDLVARYGDPAPGSGSGAVFGQVMRPYRVGNSGTVVFYSAAISGTSFESGFWRWSRTAGAAQVAVTGHPAPGTTETFATIAPESLVQDASGTIAFLATLAPSGTEALWTGAPDAILPVVRVGDAVPGEPAGTTIQSINYPVLDGLGRLAFEATVQDPTNATRRTIFRLEGTSLVRVVAEGDAAPGTPPGSTFFALQPVAMNPSGSVAFYANVVQGNCQGTCPSLGVWLANAKGVVPIALNRIRPLGAPREFLISWIDTIAINGSDQAILELALNTTYRAAYGWTQEHGLFPLAVQIEVAPGDVRTVRGAGVDGVVGGEGAGNTTVLLSTSFESDGRVFLGIGFSDFVVGVLEARFSAFAAHWLPPGVPTCPGDGTLPTACPCANVGAPGHGCDNSASTGGAILASSGEASLEADTVVLVSTGERANALSVLLQGTTSISAGVVYGDGLRCLGGTLRRIGAKNASAGSATYPGPSDPSISAKSAQLGLVLQPGDTCYYQVGYRDPDPTFCPGPTGGTLNASSGQAVTWNP